MTAAGQGVLRQRRQYNQWVANETLEDYALRFTAAKARKYSAFRVANTALGTVAFLVLEAVGAAITLSYGFTNAVAAILAVGAIIFALGVPVSYYAAKHGLDIDLLTRGAGFGYIGSTITSLIYASFTFIFFALEAAIMSLALELCFGVPLVWGYLLSALIVIPLVTHGFTVLNRFQLWTQIIWLILQLAPFIYIGMHGLQPLADWTQFTGHAGEAGGHFDLFLFGSAASVVFALVAQNGEQVDFLRFLPRARKGRKLHWWIALVCAGPGWIVPGIVKMLIGSLFAVLLVQAGLSFERAGQPTQMYLFAFREIVATPEIAIALTGIFVIISQLKINVTNAYAGSLAWSNFFSRLTHSHPGRVVWLIFNVTLALVLMELGIYDALERTLGLYSNILVAWMAAIAADLSINKPLGLSPKHIEFKRAHLHNINPVGLGGMLLASGAAIATYAGLFGHDYRGMAPFVALGVAFLAVPAIALLTRGRFYIARAPHEMPPGPRKDVRCCVCEFTFEPEDMASCPVYSGPICSLCCSLDARCHDACKEGLDPSRQWRTALRRLLPGNVASRLEPRLVKYVGLLLLCGSIAAALLAVIYVQLTTEPGAQAAVIGATLHSVFFVLLVVIAIAIWPFILAKESSLAARDETRHQTAMLMQEIEAHRHTDSELQKAKETAEAHSLAKSKYVRGISHELRTPLNAILGYAQLMEAAEIPQPLKLGIRVIRRSGDHLSNLVDGLLDISMIEAGRLQIYRDEVRLGDFLGQLVDMFSLQAREKGLAFAFEPSRHLPEIVHTDEKRLRQILINLLSNAIRCTAAGTITLRIAYSGQVARFEIEDTGPGIAAQDLGRIFLPFERIERPEQAARPGTGLGLTITKLLTEAMGGELTVASTPGKGSTFSVRLMLSAASPRIHFGSERRPPAGYEGARRTILVADDDPHHVGFVGDTLKALGFIVVTAQSGEDCLSAAGCNPDAVLLDISMPGIDGWDVARALRESHMKARIVMISADPRQESQRAAEAAYHDAYLMKPLKLPVLLDTLKQLLHLTWTYAIPPGAPAAAAAPMPRGLDAADIEALRRLGEIGHMRGILLRLDEIASETPSAAEAIGVLRRHAENCDMEAYAAALEAMEQV